MQLPVRPQPGMRIPNGWFTQLWDCLAAAMNISGDKKHIIVRRTSDGTTISLNDRGSLASAGSAAASSAYSGPWALSYDANTTLIRCKSGWLVRNGSGIWTGDLSILRSTYLVPVMVVVESRIDPGTNNWTTPVLAFREWNSSTGSGTNTSSQIPLGLWDYSTKSITQWHFSAAVHIISAYEFEV